ncbi:UDP-N-acetylmuramoyl-L-alanyl-D-glutamate--2,6-diaminopimelate ligase [bioreactor metagenome]|jgi:UDP-N-acetylmuramoyl-L-alanyl-D-glutamate--2,6-diaminopimelate ligase|uniref:UDP-N-acetylmuramoyl-L-alanyl-D-glutamate--2, 6-diaminopimelate ligase n=1 Tax=bioreactor metagenome TaxID=1076179 RepID=A0A644V0X6_9ZZZZ|nr:UDP-N-acetylmuramoyl-L-alanyl-D-glutamate--2,6-diaminopimelate ligase [Paludibacter sp.]
MLLKELLLDIKVLASVGNQEPEITGIEFDSRKVAPGYLFVATRGTAVDGHDFIAAAIEKGAVAVVCEQMPEQTVNKVAYVRVANSAEALGFLASAWYGYPSSKLTLVGVTGTNGKTTIATLLYQLFRALGNKTGLLSTVCNYVDDLEVEATHTTPDALNLNALLHQMVEAGCTYAFMEVSSHSVEQGRIAGLKFDGGVFTNLTRDHIDYHLTFENYLKAKKKFFDQLPEDSFALTNADDKNGMVMLQNTKAKKYTYSLRGLADFKTKILEHSFEGMLLDMNDKEVNVSFIGKFNASNLSAVYGAAVLLGADEMETLRIISSLKSVSGRFETLHAPSGFTAIVDYAHTPDALNNVISTINQILQGSGRLITVVGCGGNRDKGKRPMMAREAVDGSWKAILTSDNPRFEDPQEILKDMTDGLDAVQRTKALTIVDRREAIKTACALAQPGDVVLIAGKGHENYQIIQGVKHHFDDREEVKLVVNG